MEKYVQESIWYTLIRVIGSTIPFLLLIGLIYADGNILPKHYEIFGTGALTIVCISLSIGALYSLFNSKGEVGSIFGYNFIFWPTFLFLLYGIGIYTSELRDTYLDSVKTEIPSSLQSSSDSETDKVAGNSDLKNQENSNETEKQTKPEEADSPEILSKKRISKISYIFLFWITIAVFVARLFEKKNPGSVMKRREKDVDNLLKKAEA